MIQMEPIRYSMPQYEPMFLPTIQAPQIPNAQRPAEHMNPWNPYLRNYGRVYNPYSVTAIHNNAIASQPNWVNLTRNNLMCRTHPNNELLSIPFQTYRSNASLDRFASSPSRESPHRTLHSRPRSNQSSHHYQRSTPLQNIEQNFNYSSLSPIEISDSSSDEDEKPLSAVARTLNASNRNKSNCLSCKNKENESHDSYTFGNTKFNNSLAMPSTSNNEHETNSPLGSSNRMKRSHQSPQHNANKFQRINGDSHVDQNENNNVDYRLNRLHCSNQNIENSVDQVEVKPDIIKIEKTADSTSMDNQSNSEQKIKKTSIKIERNVKNEQNSDKESSDDDFISGPRKRLQLVLDAIKKE